MHTFPFLPSICCACLLAISLSGMAQDAELDLWQKSLAAEIEFYGNIMPFDEPQYSMANLPIAPAVKQYMRVSLNTTDDEALLETYDAQAAMQNQIFYTLGQLLRHPQGHTIDYLQFDGFPFHVSHSPDKRFWSFLLAENHGGTYKSRISALCYFPAQGNAILLLPPKNRGQSLQARDPFQPDGYETMVQVPSGQGTYYLLQGIVRTCGSCFVAYATLVKIEAGQFQITFEHAVGSRSPEELLTYDPAQQTLTVRYKTDDLTQDCHCQMEEKESSEPDYTVIKQCGCLFQFDGQTFQLVDSTESVIPEGQD